MGMVGGGITGFIGAIHLRAALMENMIELVCGCFSSKPEVSKESGRAYFLPDNRIYNTYQEMFEKEMNLPENERMDFRDNCYAQQISFRTGHDGIGKRVPRGAG